MTFEEFLKVTGKALLKDKDNWIAESYFNPKSHEVKKKSSDPYDSPYTFHVTWTLGGTAGNYTGNVYTVNAELEPDEPKEFDQILENICPNLTFMQYKAISREVMQRREVRHSDYYGGSTTEGDKGFYIKDLFEALDKRGLLP